MQPSSSPARPPLTCREVELLTRVSRDTLRRWWRSGQFPEPFRLGHSLLWDRAAVETALAARQAEAAAHAQ